MPEAAIGTPERVAQHVITSENREAFVLKNLDITPPSAPAPELPAGGEKPPASLGSSSDPNAKQPAQAAEPGKDEAAKLEADLKAEEAKPQPDEKKKEGIRERLSVLTQKRKDAEAETAKERSRAEKAERELAEERARRAAPPPAPAAEEAQEPRREAYGTDQEYLQASIAYGVKKALGDERKAQAEAFAKQETERQARSYNERLAVVKAEVPDFDQRLEKAKDLPIPPYIAESIRQSEVGPRMVLYFADNVGEATRIANLPPLAALREFGKIEAMIETQAKPKSAPAAEAPKAAPALSAAPPPITPIKATGAAVDAKVDGEGRFTGTYAEFRALRKAGKL